jgi:hypothetical protein
MWHENAEGTANRPLSFFRTDVAKQKVAIPALRSRYRHLTVTKGGLHRETFHVKNEV